MVICLERGADLHMVQLMPLPLTVSCFSEIQIGFTFLVPAHPGSPGQRAVGVCVPFVSCRAILLSIYLLWHRRALTRGARGYLPSEAPGYASEVDWYVY